MVLNFKVFFLYLLADFRRSQHKTKSTGCNSNLKFHWSLYKVNQTRIYSIQKYNGSIRNFLERIAVGVLPRGNKCTGSERTLILFTPKSIKIV